MNHLQANVVLTDGALKIPQSCLKWLWTRFSKLKSNYEIFPRIMIGTKIMVIIILVGITEVMAKEDIPSAIIDLHSTYIGISVTEGTIIAKKMAI